MKRKHTTNICWLVINITMQKFQSIPIKNQGHAGVNYTSVCFLVNHLLHSSSDQAVRPPQHLLKFTRTFHAQTALPRPSLRTSDKIQRRHQNLKDDAWDTLSLGLKEGLVDYFPTLFPIWFCNLRRSEPKGLISKWKCLGQGRKGRIVSEFRKSQYSGQRYLLWRTQCSYFEGHWISMALPPSLGKTCLMQDRGFEWIILDCVFAIMTLDRVTQGPFLYDYSLNSGRHLYHTWAMSQFENEVLWDLC